MNESQQLIEGLDFNNFQKESATANVQDLPKITDSASVIILYNCGKCGKDFPTQKILTNHFKTHSRKKWHVCLVCFVMFKNTSEFKKHNLTHYPGLKSSNNEMTKVSNYMNKKYKCKICSKRFRLKVKLNEHHRYHEEEKWLRKLKSKEDLPKTDEKTKSYSCKICNKVFHNTFIYKHHTESHNSDPQAPEIFSCDICKKYFKRELYLKRHTKEIHSDEKKHQCRTCHKKFSRAELLRGHNEKHHCQDD